MIYLWELHPLLVHFPIAFLLAAVALDLFSLARRRSVHARMAAGLYLAGVVGGGFAAAAGLLAWFHAPMPSDPGVLLHAHPIGATATLVLFGAIATHRWRNRRTPPSRAAALWIVIGAVMLVGTVWLGTQLAHRHGVGVLPDSRTPAPARNSEIEQKPSGEDGRHP